MKKSIRLVIAIAINAVLMESMNASELPTGIQFNSESLKRLGHKGDNWCITWTQDGSQITSMDDGNWLNGPYSYHNHLYRIIGNAENFARKDIPGYPQFVWEGEGWFGYGIVAVNGTIYSMVSRTPSANWDGPFRGVKMLKSPDNGLTWYRVNKFGHERRLTPWDPAREAVNHEEMFFLEENGENRDGTMAYPFSFCSFVQNGQDNNAAVDDFIYIYSPEGAQSNRLLLARVEKDSIEKRSSWEYFESWHNKESMWTKDISKRTAVYVFPEKNSKEETFGWYSWLPSIVWNNGLGLYIMVNGGTYAGHGLTDSSQDYFDSWMHTKTGSLGFWYSKNPYGPWTKFFYTDYWMVDDENNRTYQPKLSPKWISADGKTMVLIWSDAMKNQEGRSHTVNYHWNQMEIILETKSR